MLIGVLQVIHICSVVLLIIVLVYVISMNIKKSKKRKKAVISIFSNLSEIDDSFRTIYKYIPYLTKMLPSSFKNDIDSLKSRYERLLKKEDGTKVESLSRELWNVINNYIDIGKYDSSIELESLNVIRDALSVISTRCGVMERCINMKKFRKYALSINL